MLVCRNMLVGEEDKEEPAEYFFGTRSLSGGVWLNGVGPSGALPQPRA